MVTPVLSEGSDRTAILTSQLLPPSAITVASVVPVDGRALVSGAADGEAIAAAGEDEATGPCGPRRAVGTVRG